MTEPLRQIGPGGQRSEDHSTSYRDRKGDPGEAVIGLAIPGKPIGHHHHPL
jgi:hypothetical protein